MNTVSLNSFSTLVLALALSGLASSPLMASSKDTATKLSNHTEVTNRLEASAERSGSYQGKRKEKQPAADRISLSRRTEARKDRATTSGLVIGLDAAANQNGKTSRNGSPELRSNSPQSSSQAFGFSFYDASVFLNFDRDSDGYFSDFTLEFDADYDEGSAEVYAVVYTSQNGADWQELFVTDVFVISLDSVEDTQSITTALNFGFPTGDYDILIDLFENGIPGIVASIDPTSDADLFALPLEDSEHDLNTNVSDISFVASTLSSDLDGDGFYTDVTLEYDIDTDYSGDTVYAEIVVTDTFDGSRQFLTTGNFILGNQTEFIDLTFNAGYPAGWYDIQINLINVFTNEIIANAAREFSSLRALPIESLEKDNRFDSFEVDEVDVVLHSGSFGLGLALLGLLAVRRKR